MAARGLTSVGDVSFRSKPREFGDTSIHGADQMGQAAGAQAGGANADYAHDRALGDQARDQGNAARGAQVDAMGMARARATGQAPSVAQMQGDRDQAALARTQGSMAASARGAAGLALAQQGAAANVSQSGAQISQSSQIAAAQERQAAESAYAQQAGGIRGGDAATRGQDLQSAATSSARGLGFSGLQANTAQADAANRLGSNTAQMQGGLQADQINSGINAQNAANEKSWFDRAMNAGAQAAGGAASALSDARAKEPILSDVIGKESPGGTMQLGGGGGMDVMGSLKATSDFATKNVKQGQTAGASPISGMMMSDAKTKAAAYREGVLASVVGEGDVKGSQLPSWGKGDAEKSNAAYQAKAEVTPPNPDDKGMSTDADIAMLKAAKDRETFQDLQSHFNDPTNQSTPKLPGIAMGADTSKLSMADIDNARRRSQAPPPEAAAGKSQGSWEKIGAGIGNLFKSDARAKDPIMSSVDAKQALSGKIDKKMGMSGEGYSTHPDGILSDIVGKEPAFGKMMAEHNAEKASPQAWLSRVMSQEKYVNPLAPEEAGIDPSKLRVTKEGMAFDASAKADTGHEGGAGDTREGKKAKRKPTLSESEKWANEELSKSSHTGKSFFNAKTDEASKWADDELAKPAQAGTKSYVEQLAESARSLESAPYAYKPEFTPPDQKPGEMNVGPMAQNLAIDPLARSAVKPMPGGMLGLDRDKLLKLNSAQIANLQKQIDAKKGGG